MSEKQNPLKDKSFHFALVIVKLYKCLSEEKREYVMSKNYFDRGLQLELIFEKLKMLKVKPILFINYLFLKKSVMKSCIGWNCYTNLNI